MNIIKIVNVQHKLSLFSKSTVVLQISRYSCYQKRNYERSDRTHHYSAHATPANAKTCYVTTTITHYLVYQTTTITTNTNKYLLNKIKHFYQYSIYCTYSTIFKNNNVRNHLNGIVRCNNKTLATTTNLISTSAKNIIKMWKFATRTFKEAFGNGSAFGNGGGATNGVTSHCRCTLNNLFNNDDQQLLLQTTSTLGDNSNDDNDNNLVVTDESPTINNNFNYCIYKSLYQISFQCTNTLQSLGWYINHFLSSQKDSSINKPQIKQAPVNNKQLLILDTNNYKKIGIRLTDLTLITTPKLPKTIITNALSPQIIDTFQLKDVKTKSIGKSNSSTENTTIAESTNNTTESFIDFKLNITKNDDTARSIQVNAPKTNIKTTTQTTETKNSTNNEQAIEDAAARFAFVTGVLENQLGAAYLKQQQQKTNNSNLVIAIGHFEAGILYKNASAAFNLGLCYELGIGTKQNYQAAAKCYKTAIELGGHTKAMYNLAIYYVKGLGDLPQDFNVAYQLFLNAAQKGHLQSKQALHSVQEYNNINMNKTTNLQEKQLLTC